VPKSTNGRGAAEKIARSHFAVRGHIYSSNARRRRKHVHSRGDGDNGGIGAGALREVAGLMFRPGRTAFDGPAAQIAISRDAVIRH
jgi:hypothetical protein